MDPVGQARSACSACRRSAPETGWVLTKDVSTASPKTEGAICRQASQSMHVESTKKSPGTFSGTRFWGFAMIGPPFAPFYPRGEALESWRRPQRAPQTAERHFVPIWVASGHEPA